MSAFHSSSSGGGMRRRRVLRVKRKRSDMEEAGELGDVIVLKTKRTRKISDGICFDSGQGLISAMGKGLTLDHSAHQRSISAEHDRIMVFRRVQKKGSTTTMSVKSDDKPSTECTMSIGRKRSDRKRKTDQRTAALLESARELMYRERLKRDSRKARIRSVNEGFDKLTDALDAVAAAPSSHSLTTHPTSLSSSSVSESERGLVEYLQLRCAAKSDTEKTQLQWSLKRDVNHSEELDREMEVDSDDDSNNDFEEFEQISEDKYGHSLDELAKKAKPAAIFFVDMGQLEDYTDGLMDEMALSTSTRDECYDFSLGSKRRKKERRWLTDDHTSQMEDIHSMAVSEFLSHVDRDGRQLKDEQKIIERMEQATASECRVLGYQSEADMDDDDWDNPDDVDYYGNDYGSSEESSDSRSLGFNDIESDAEDLIDPMNDDILLQM